MNEGLVSRNQWIELGKLSAEDLAQIQACRRSHNRLAFGYQLAFVKVHNRFPVQNPFEADDELLNYVGIQLELSDDQIELYSTRQQTVSQHQTRIRHYLRLRSLDEKEQEALKQFLFTECCRLEETSQLRTLAQRFLREKRILEPAATTLDRMIGEQRRQARQHLFKKLFELLSEDAIKRLDALLLVGEGSSSPLQILKEVPGTPSASAVLRLTAKLKDIAKTGVLDFDLTWLNNNYQRSLARHARKSSAFRLRESESSHRYAALVCFLREANHDTIDLLVDMLDKLLCQISRKAEREIDEAMKKSRASIRSAATLLQSVAGILLDEETPDEAVREKIFAEIVSRTVLLSQTEDLREMTEGKNSHEFHGFVRRFSYLRRFSPALFEALGFQGQGQTTPPVLRAIEVLRAVNEEAGKALPEDAPTDFVPKKLERFVLEDGRTNRPAWECALLLNVCEELKAGNLAVAESKRFGQFDQFFVPDGIWGNERSRFFERAGLPSDAAEVSQYLTGRLNAAYDAFLQSQTENSFASVDESGWQLSKDPAEELSGDEEQKLSELKKFLSDRMRGIQLSQLLIEVDNDLNFSRHFINPSRREMRRPEDVCPVLATVLALGCNIGPSTMTRLTEDVSYEQIKRIIDWEMTRENQRSALADVVKAISSVGTSKTWGEGRASSSDGQRFLFPRKVLQRTFSDRMSDYALEFYSFVADNYAPFYSTPIECNDRDAAYVLDGLLYNESELTLEEHYTDTHGSTEINFAAFTMLGKRFCPRIRGIQHQQIYRIDLERDYGPLAALVDRKDRTIHLDWITEQWDRMGQFYVSLESGHATASVALKRLVSFSGKNHFYRANRELGWFFKTEFILQYLSQTPLRRRIRRGLLKGEQLHSLARDIFYGKRGRIVAQELDAQMNTCSSLTLILACIIYWQAREIERVIADRLPSDPPIDIELLEHISPISWDNVVLYGQYTLDRDLIQNP